MSYRGTLKSRVGLSVLTTHTKINRWGDSLNKLKVDISYNLYLFQESCYTSKICIMLFTNLKMNGANKMAQWLKMLAAWAWWPEFDLQNPRGKETLKLSSDLNTGVHVHIQAPHINKYIQENNFKWRKKCLLKKKDSRERPCPFHQLWAQDEDGIPLQRRSILASSAWPCSLWKIHFHSGQVTQPVSRDGDMCTPSHGHWASDEWMMSYHGHG